MAGLQKDLTAVLKKVELQLHKGGFDWVNVLYIHLYIANMNDFALANETYVSFITERKCNLGVPSRSTIELPLMQVGLGKAYVEILVANDQTKKVLHVQSISRWAPSCIGPYSQVNTIASFSIIFFPFQSLLSAYYAVLYLEISQIPLHVCITCIPFL